jgi:replicative DNA helicase
MPLHPSHFETSKAIEEQLIAGIILRPGDFYAVAEALHPSDFVTQAMADAWQAFQSMAKEGVEFQRESVMISGIPLGSYAILAARPSIGKSALAMDIAQNAAANGDASLFVSLEMSNQQIGQRQFVKNADVRIMEMQSASYSDEACLRMLKACSDAKQLPLYVWQAAGVSMGRIESRVRSVVAKHGARLVVIDYLGLIRGQDAHQKTYERVTQISGELARLSKQLNVALLVLCQLGRAAEGEEPSINMLRDSGAIEQDADIVMLLHREARDSQDATVLIEKQRNGKVGKFGLRFDGKRFSDIFQQAAEFHGDFQ